MLEIMDVIFDSIIDSVKIVPFLFFTYLVMEYIEHKISNKSKNAISKACNSSLNNTRNTSTFGSAIKKADNFGPIIGGLLGAIPQCGFSVSATNLYAGRVITIRNFNCNIFSYF